MGYTEEAISEIKEEFMFITSSYIDLMIKLHGLQQKLSNSKSREYLIHGVSRRLNILNKCIHNIFALFPVDRSDLLTSDELTDLVINLHAFFINISGVLDNLAWVFVYEKDLYGHPKNGKLSRLDVGLFADKTQTHLWPDLTNYLKSNSIKTWYDKYSKDYRDALAHRIPLYVPPSAIDENEAIQYKQLEDQINALDIRSPDAITIHGQLIEKLRQLGRPCVLFSHSLHEGCKLVYFHAQVIADFKTIEEIVVKFCDEWPLKA